MDITTALAPYKGATLEETYNNLEEATFAAYKAGNNPAKTGVERLRDRKVFESLCALKTAVEKQLVSANGAPPADLFLFGCHYTLVK